MPLGKGSSELPVSLTHEENGASSKLFLESATPDAATLTFGASFGEEMLSSSKLK